MRHTQVLETIPAKKTAYLALFTLLGILVQFVVHALVEVVLIALLVTNFERYGLGLSWETWEMIHLIGTVVLLLAGAGVGLWQGMRWWKTLYT